MSLGTASTETEVRPWAIVIDAPSDTFEPSILNVFKEVSFEKAGPETTIVTVYLAVAPFAAVTSTVKVLLPVFRPVEPVTSATASGSVGSAITVTSVVPLATVTVAPSVTSSPFTAKTASEVSLLAAT